MQTQTTPVHPLASASSTRPRRNRRSTGTLSTPAGGSQSPSSTPIPIHPMCMGRDSQSVLRARVDQVLPGHSPWEVIRLVVAERMASGPFTAARDAISPAVETRDGSSWSSERLSRLGRSSKWGRANPQEQRDCFGDEGQAKISDPQDVLFG